MELRSTTLPDERLYAKIVSYSLIYTLVAGIYLGGVIKQTSVLADY